MDRNLFEGSLSRFQANLGAQTEFQNSVSAWVAQALHGSLGPGGLLSPKPTLLDCVCVGRAAQVGRSPSTWVAQPQNSVHALQNSEIGPPLCKHDLGAMKLVQMKLVWLLYMSQISSQSDFISNLISNPYYKCFCNFHFWLFQIQTSFGFFEVDTNDFAVFLQGYDHLG